MNDDTVPAYQAVDNYLDDLLSEAQPEALAAVEDNAWPPSSTDYLMCTAAGVSMAIPMGQVEDLLPAPLDDGHPSLIHDGEQHLRICNLGRMLADGLHEPAANALIVLDGWRWALACRTTEDVVSKIAIADVDWRSSRAQRATRPWLGGMHKSGRCALLDVVMLQQMLDEKLVLDVQSTMAVSS